MLLLLVCFVSVFALPATAGREVKDGQVYMRGWCHSLEGAAERLEIFGAAHHGRASWETRADTIRQNILIGAKLDPLPEDRGPMRVIRHSKKQRNGYTVENVAIETLPGFWLCGNLYLPDHYDPDKGTAKLPGVLCPHGHKPDKRFDEQVQARSAAFARLGCAVFAYDMIGQGETKQVEHKIDQALRLQTWNSIRALDYLSALPGIDEDRLAVTGGSGGGTQSFLLAAIDERIDLSMPVVMVAARFYGGCVCESGMPIHVRGDFATNNVEIAAAIAPKPLLLVSNGDDWTKHTPELELPYVKNIYGYYDAEANVENAHFADEKHDYGPSKRAAAARFLAKHFKLDLAPILNDQGEVDEGWYEELPFDSLRAFNDDHPMPAGALTTPAQVEAQLDAVIKLDSDTARPDDRATIDRPEGTRLRIANYNVYFGSTVPQDNGQPPLPGKRDIKDRTESFIRLHQAIKPDVWALQEVLYSDDERRTKTVQGHLKFFNQAIGEDWHIAADEKGRMVFSRYPITWSKEVTNRVFGVLIDVPNKVAPQDVLVLNLHLTPGNPDSQLRSARQAAAFLNKVDAGEIEAIPPGVTVIVCGDFNSLSSDPPYRVLQAIDPGLPERGAYEPVLRDPKPVQFNNGGDATLGSVHFEDGQHDVNGKQIDFLLYRSSALQATNQYVLNTLIMGEAVLTQHELQRSDVALDPNQTLQGRVKFDHLPIVVDFAAK